MGIDNVSIPDIENSGEASEIEIDMEAYDKDRKKCDEPEVHSEEIII